MSDVILSKLTDPLHNSYNRSDGSALSKSDLSRLSASSSSSSSSQQCEVLSSQSPHPLLSSLPFWMVHPCKTAEFVQQMLAETEEGSGAASAAAGYLRAYLSVVDQVIVPTFAKEG